MNAETEKRWLQRDEALIENRDDCLGNANRPVVVPARNQGSHPVRGLGAEAGKGRGSRTQKSSKDNPSELARPCKENGKAHQFGLATWTVRVHLPSIFLQVVREQSCQ